ncbi:dTDP-4-dehydrorhamnose 3,5-epimerase [Gammaproteobacteria bacterium]|nr:dTDP-4-dehydrorhamnose 3,5-epimerase [Gammaproteobacteria bacterium]
MKNLAVQNTSIDGVVLIQPNEYGDERGFFLENFKKSAYAGISIENTQFVQDNLSRSKKDVLRGMHYTISKPQAQMLTVVRGKIFDVVVDLRRNSQTFGKWYGVELGDGCPRQIYMPHGIAHGFCVLSDWADLHYKVTEEYDPLDEGGLLWNDSTIGIQWPLQNPLVGAKDSKFPILENIHYNQLPQVY